MNGTVRIMGSHDHGDGRPELIKTINDAHCAQDGDYFIITYDEAQDSEGNQVNASGKSQKDSRHVIHHTLTIGPGKVIMTRSGALTSELHFGLGKVWHTDYETHFGVMKMTAVTRQLLVEITTKKISAHLQYELQMDGNKVSDSKVRISFVYN